MSESPNVQCLPRVNVLKYCKPEKEQIRRCRFNSGMLISIDKLAFKVTFVQDFSMKIKFLYGRWYGKLALGPEKVNSVSRDLLPFSFWH